MSNAGAAAAFAALNGWLRLAAPLPAPPCVLPGAGQQVGRGRWRGGQELLAL